ncbi:hypothetical protein COY93_03275 [Candidatus Uhrbacteria bacterium CG_4_10_14_0_8_um_filter_58_22]|uniref:Uncharacterized protein n=1 Tax=Candidatus Uhrbacteria bacterium CG_4_10_14_0_8_um_filter_58_22 TaxID=1975029 RepID=A0A2M7Q9Q3_9BACT|nr:MAG: hypothetical protein COY93_03275 [Candidatus Uhrbacteria bacterium CG_4_10_14_0_8_um_filter_58_22]
MTEVPGRKRDVPEDATNARPKAASERRVERRPRQPRQAQVGRAVSSLHFFDKTKKWSRGSGGEDLPQLKRINQGS